MKYIKRLALLVNAVAALFAYSYLMWGGSGLMSAWYGFALLICTFSWLVLSLTWPFILGVDGKL